MRILYICTHNRCRSILAEAVTRHLAAHRITAASAGSSPVGEVHPLSIKYLNNSGINTDNLHSQSWDLYADFQPDAVVLMCHSAANESCPVWFDSTATVRWEMADPSLESENEEKSRAAFKCAIETLETRISALLALPFEQFTKQERIDHLTSLAD